MIRLSLEVGRGASRREIEVWAQSIQGAVSLAEEHFLSEEIQVVFLIDAEGFFPNQSASAGFSGVTRKGWSRRR